MSIGRKMVVGLLFVSSLVVANMPPGGFDAFVKRYFVETGTYGGKGIRQALAAGFEQVRSIELDANFYNQAREAFRSNRNVKLYQGDSGSKLFEVIRDIDEPITFWLDGHNGVYDPHGENTPLLRELDQIKMHHIKTHTILIDDMHCTGGELFDFITKDMIIAKIKEINPDYEISYIDGGDDSEVANNIMVARIRA